MSSYSAYPGGGTGLAAPTAPTPWVDPTRRGSPWQQAATGIVGLLLAVTLVVGQISVATTKGMASNLHANIKHLKDGNNTMREIIEKAAPSVLMEKVVAHQQKTLSHTTATMKLLNGEMETTTATKDELMGTVGRMKSTSASLASGVEGMSNDTRRMADLLEPLPTATEDTHRQLGRIAGDSAAINTELGAIARKMKGYGLPHAKNVGGKRERR